MDLFRFFVSLSTLLCSLVTGIALTFMVVVMPGIKNLDDRGFLRSFKVMDRIIQNNQPIFMLVWIGSILALTITNIMGLWRLEGLNRLLLAATAVCFYVGVMLPTGTINVPLNNKIQQLDLECMDEPDLEEARKHFEKPWVRWNMIRTVFAIITTVLLIVLLQRL